MKKILVFFIATILFCLLYSLFAYISLPVSEKWLANVYQVKKELIRNAKGKRIIVVGGSSSLFGMNGGVIESNISQSYKFINLATHAGLPISYHIDQVLQFAQKGDVVMMPLEFSYYTKKEPYNDAWYIQNILSWDKDYRKYITYEDTFIVLLKTKLRDFLTPIKSLFLKNKSPVYSSKNLNQWGDFCIRQESQFNDKNHFFYLDNEVMLSQFFITEIKRAKQKLNAMGANLILTYPPTLKNTHFDLNQKNFSDSINRIKTQLFNIGIEIIGEAKDFHYPPDLFLDTQYHLNCKGSIKRSEDFSRVLNQWLKTR